MMLGEDRADDIFSRKYSLQICAAIARLPEDKSFTTAQIATFAGVPPADVSKELGHLVSVRLIKKVRHGEYIATPDNFWAACDSIAEGWAL